MKKIFKNFVITKILSFSFLRLEDNNSFSLKKLVVDDNPYQKYGLAAAGGTVVSFASIIISDADFIFDCYWRGLS